MFDLNEASDKLETTYQKPGISNVTITGVVLEETSLNSVPYIRVTTKSDNGDIGTSSRMYLSTDKKEGKKSSGWAVTARTLTDIIAAAHNISDDDAKQSIKAENSIELVNKLSAKLVGQKVRAKFKGETSERGTVFATLDRTESVSVPEGESRLKFNASTDIKPYTGPNASTATVETIGINTNTDLPF